MLLSEKEALVDMLRAEEEEKRRILSEKQVLVEQLKAEKEEKRRILADNSLVNKDRM